MSIEANKNNNELNGNLYLNNQNRVIHKRSSFLKSLYILNRKYQRGLVQACQLSSHKPFKHFNTQIRQTKNLQVSNAHPPSYLQADRQT